MSDIPEGFELLETHSPFIKNVGPLYYHSDGEQFVLGLLLEDHHCNSSGRLHGAMVSALADIALGRNVWFALAKSGAFKEPDENGMPSGRIATINMTTDFAGTARPGDWVEAHVEVQRAGKRVAFANSYLVNDGERIARVSGVYQVVAR